MRSQTPTSRYLLSTVELLEISEQPNGPTQVENSRAEFPHSVEKRGTDFPTESGKCETCCRNSLRQPAGRLPPINGTSRARSSHAEGNVARDFRPRREHSGAELPHSMGRLESEFHSQWNNSRTGLPDSMGKSGPEFPSHWGKSGRIPPQSERKK